jgi:ubiquinone biosynthesis monooxygenase Coq6
MQVWEHDGPAQLHFTGEDLSNAIEDGRLVDLGEFVNSEKEEEEGMTTTTKTTKKSSRKRPWLGAVIEDAPLVSSLWDELRDDDRIDLLDNVQIKTIRAPSLGEMGNVIPPPPIQLSYTRSKEIGAGECMTTISSDLLVAADGANSQVRSLVGTFPMMKYPYDKKAVTCTVEVESSMTHTAYQRFLSHGPIALLPVWNGHSMSKDSPTYANVVWSTTTSEANYLLSLSPSEFISALNLHLRQGPNVNPSLLPDSNASNQPSSVPALFSTIAKEVDSLLRTTNTALTMGTWTESPSRNYFRMPPKSIRVVGSIFGFDLSMSHVMMTSSLSSSSTGGTYGGGYTSPRVALVGDAAHTMHPMAGQGLNLGMGDVALLSNLIKESIDSGMDVGGTSLFLDRYNRERMVNGMSVVGGVHSLHEIFGVSGTAPGSMADGTYDAGKGNAGSLRSLVGYSRSLGMNVVNGLPFVRRMLAEIAAGATQFKKAT